MNNSPFHDPNAQPLPDANDIEQEALGRRPQREDELANVAETQGSSPQMESEKRKLRNLMIGLLVIGFVVGGILAIGLVWVMNRLDLIEPPTVEQSIHH